MKYKEIDIKINISNNIEGRKFIFMKYVCLRIYLCLCVCVSYQRTKIFGKKTASFSGKNSNNTNNLMFIKNIKLINSKI